MGSRLLRRLGCFEAEEDPRWEEEYRLEQAERMESDQRYRLYRADRLFWRLKGIDKVNAGRIAAEVYGFPSVEDCASRYFYQGNLHYIVRGFQA